jgi:tetratricopeptide (TPR) repeat protein
MTTPNTQPESEAAKALRLANSFIDDVSAAVEPFDQLDPQQAPEILENIRLALKQIDKAARLAPGAVIVDETPQGERALNVSILRGACLMYQGLTEAFALNDLTKAARTLEAALACAPKFANAHYALAYIYADLNKRQESLEHARRALELDSENIEYQKIAEKLSSGAAFATPLSTSEVKQAKRKLILSTVFAAIGVGIGFAVGDGGPTSSGPLGNATFLGYAFWGCYWGIPVVWRGFWGMFNKLGCFITGWLMILFFCYIPVAGGYLYGVLGGGIYQFIKHLRIVLRDKQGRVGVAITQTSSAVPLTHPRIERNYRSDDGSPASAIVAETRDAYSGAPEAGFAEEQESEQSSGGDVACPSIPALETYENIVSERQAESVEERPKHLLRYINWLRIAQTLRVGVPLLSDIRVLMLVCIASAAICWMLLAADASAFEFLYAPLLLGITLFLSLLPLRFCALAALQKLAAQTGGVLGLGTTASQARRLAAEARDYYTSLGYPIHDDTLPALRREFSALVNQTGAGGGKPVQLQYLSNRGYPAAIVGTALLVLSLAAGLIRPPALPRLQSTVALSSNSPPSLPSASPHPFVAAPQARTVTTSLQPPQSPAQTKRPQDVITFVRDGHLWAMDSLGQGERRLTETADVSVAKASESGLVVFQRNPKLQDVTSESPDLASDLYLLTPDGQESRLTQDGLSSEPLVSRDGRRVVFQRRVKGGRVGDREDMRWTKDRFDIYLLDLESGKERLLVGAETIPFSGSGQVPDRLDAGIWYGSFPVAISDDGSSLIFKRTYFCYESGTASDRFVYRMRFDKAGAPEHIRNASGGPDLVIVTDWKGTQLLYDHWAEPRGMYLCDLPKGEHRLLEEGYVHHGKFSPDGNRIAYIRTNDSNAELWVRNLEKVGGARLGRYLGEGDYPPDIEWNSDSKRILVRFASKRPIEVINTDDESRQLLTVAGHGASWGSLNASLLTAGSVSRARLQQADPGTGPHSVDIPGFIRQHLEAETTRNLAAVTANYDTTVDYFSNGRKDLEFIRTDKANYFERWPSGSERVVGTIDIASTARDEWTATFVSAFRVENSSGDWIEGEAQNTYGLLRKDNEIKITSQKVSIIKKEKGGPVVHPSGIPEAEITDFIVSHQRKEESGHLDQIMQDYAQTVQYFDHGSVDHHFIRKDKANYFERWPKLSYRLLDDPRISALGGRRFSVAFTQAFYVENEGAEWISGEVENQNQIIWEDGAYRISLEQGTVTKREKGTRHNRRTDAGTTRQQDSGVRLYGFGEYPSNMIVYAVPDLKELIGRPLKNAWLYGNFTVAGVDGNTYVLKPYFDSRSYGIGLSVNGEEVRFGGSTDIIVTFLQNPRLRQDSSIRFRRSSPLELLSVDRSTNGAVVARARCRHRYY